MVRKALVGTAVFALLSVATLGVVSASPNQQAQVEVSPFNLLIVTLGDANDKGLLADYLGNLLADWLIGSLIVPHTGETRDEIKERLSVHGKPSFQSLIAVIKDANDKGAFPDDLSDSLSDWFIENLIAPHTGETPEQVRERLSLHSSPPDYIKWEIGDQVSQEHQQNVMEAVRLMHDYAVSLGLPEIEDEVTFYLYHYGDELIEAYARETGWSVEQSREYWDKGGTAVAGEGYIVVNASSEWYATEPRRIKQMKTAAHELYHAYQHGLSGLRGDAPSDRVPEQGPRWLSEGSAEFLAYQAMSEGDVLSYDTERNSTDPWGFVEHGKYVDTPLSEMETWTGFSGVRGSPYRYSLLAAELLASYAGESALLRYYQLLQPGITWQQAFQTIFRMPVEEFYIFFEEHRAAGFPETSAYISGNPNFIFGPDVDEDFRRQIMDDMDFLRQWFTDDLGTDIDEATTGVTVFVFGDGAIEGVKMRRLDAFIAFREDLTPADRDSLMTQWAWSVGAGMGSYDFLLTCTCNPARTRLSLAHELTHTVQANLAGEAWTRARDIPVWLIEGTAEHLSRVFAAERGMEKCSPNRCYGADSFNGYLLSALDNPPLQTQETREGLAGLKYPYASGMVASAILAELTGLPSLMEFFSLTGQGHEWRDAFQEAFGMTVSEFYELYERSKEAGFPEVPPSVRELP